MNNNVNMLVDPIVQTPAAYMAGTSMLPPTSTKMGE